MGCESILDKVYEQEDLSFWGQVYVSMHLFTCPDCARKARLFELSRRIIRDEFLPPSPGLESTVMAAIAEEEGEALDAGTEAREIAVSGGFSLRGWVVVGIALLFSLTTIFLGMGFNDVALAAGMSLMIPIGITVGILITGYGALFIGSHLKRLSERFDLQ